MIAACFNQDARNRCYKNDCINGQIENGSFTDIKDHHSNGLSLGKKNSAVTEEGYLYLCCSGKKYT